MRPAYPASVCHDSSGHSTRIPLLKVAPARTSGMRWGALMLTPDPTLCLVVLPGALRTLIVHVRPSPPDAVHWLALPLGLPTDRPSPDRLRAAAPRRETGHRSCWTEYK